MVDDVAGRLRAAGLKPDGWANGPGEWYPAHQHDYDKVIAVERGSITFGLPETGEEVPLVAGDRLNLPAGTLHNAVVGPEGVACVEAHVPAGSIEGLIRRAAGTW